MFRDYLALWAEVFFGGMFALTMLAMVNAAIGEPFLIAWVITRVRTD